MTTGLADYTVIAVRGGRLDGEILVKMGSTWHPVGCETYTLPDGPENRTEYDPEWVVPVQELTYEILAVPQEPEVVAGRAVDGELVREALMAMCARLDLSVESDVAPGNPAPNYELALRLGIGEVFGVPR